MQDLRTGQSAENKWRGVLRHKWHIHIPLRPKLRGNPRRRVTRLCEPEVCEDGSRTVSSGHGSTDLYTHGRCGFP